MGGTCPRAPAVRRMFRIGAALLLPVTLEAQVTPPVPRSDRIEPIEAWHVDTARSGMTFAIRHLLSRVRGTFREWKGTITLADPERWERGSVDVEIRTESIFTDNTRRDNHLRTSDFFLADSFPTISFRSTRVEREGDEGRIHGLLTIRGITRTVVLHATFRGFQRAPDGTERVAFQATTTINRLHYGIVWNRALEGGGVTLGDDVKIEIALEAVRASSR
jgi:polyisoprenoid-binding protein YceI